MSTSPKDGGPAFPIQQHRLPNGSIDDGSKGMTLRDWFAGQAMAGLAPPEGYTLSHKDAPGLINDLARRAYALADAMLAAQERSQS